MSVPLRVGIFGVGQVYRRLYAPALALCPQFTVAATADPVSPADFASPEALLAAAGIDAVVVLSPPALHAAHAAAAIGRGLPVLVEKPPALTVAEVQAWPRPELVTPAFSRRFWSAYRSPLGPGRRFSFTLETNPADWGATASEPVERDLLPHAADLAVWLSGERIASVEGVVRTPHSAAGVFLLSEGGSFEWSVAHAAAYREALSVDGREVRLPGTGPIAEALRRVRRQPPQAVAGVAALLAAWARALEGHPSPSLPRVEEARSCARVVEAVEAIPLGGSP